ncbi:ABC transporter substrate-binding protein [Candidimonas nitroreducens]|uniref:Peptide ABC transporter substrate-binding protein n=1 Tax=Candidimonas nitroreducens TaxID=683354 RepID=A0A225MJ64_9BURK|nr:ABC transporter substrate-binding protein [Candidimonas nitroreducens]OWT58959.1 peptide ABC transporter substrate-binding protein [Candidimonas nitroreducens]
MTHGKSLLMPVLLTAIFGIAICSSSMAQKRGGTLHAPLRDNPPSASVAEETTSSTLVPFMPIFNNLVVFDQLAKKSLPSNIKPDLAEHWKWSDDGKVLTFELAHGVKWHDGVPFTSADVKCTWDTIRGVRDGGWRKNPRKSWYENLKDVVTHGDYEVSFVLDHPQPSLLSFLASGFSPVYPCHVDGQTMRTHPIGTGPFKLVEYRRNREVKLVRNPDYFKKGKPYLDAIEYRVIPNEGTRTLAFVSGQLDMTWADVSLDGEKNIKAQQPDALCDLAALFTLGELIYNPNEVALKDDRLRRAIMLAIDRKALAQVMTQGHAVATGIFMPPPAGSWGLTTEEMKGLPGFDPDVEKNREAARKLMEQMGYSSEHHKQLKLMVVNRPAHVTPATLLADQLRKIFIDVTLDAVDISVWGQRVTRRAGYQFTLWSAAPAIDNPDVILFEQLSCKSSRNYSNYCDSKTQEMIEQQSQIADQEKRLELVHAIDRRIAQQAARPALFTSYLGVCQYPYVKNAVRATNSIYNTYRFEDVWLNK